MCVRRQNFPFRAIERLELATNRQEPIGSSKNCDKGPIEGSNELGNMPSHLLLRLWFYAYPVSVSLAPLPGPGQASFVCRRLALFGRCLVTICFTRKTTTRGIYSWTGRYPVPRITELRHAIFSFKSLLCLDSDIEDIFGSPEVLMCQILGL